MSSLNPFLWMSPPNLRRNLPMTRRALPLRRIMIRLPVHPPLHRLLRLCLLYHTHLLRLVLLLHHHLYMLRLLPIALRTVNVPVSLPNGIVTMPGSGIRLLLVTVVIAFDNNSCRGTDPLLLGGSWATTNWKD